MAWRARTKRVSNSESCPNSPSAAKVCFFEIQHSQVADGRLLVADFHLHHSDLPHACAAGTRPSCSPANGLFIIATIDTTRHSDHSALAKSHRLHFTREAGLARAGSGWVPSPHSELGQGRSAVLRRSRPQRWGKRGFEGGIPESQRTGGVFGHVCCGLLRLRWRGWNTTGQTRV